MTPFKILQSDPQAFGFNVAHVATISSSLPKLATRFNFRVEQELDDLQEYDVAYLELDSGFHFYLCKYKSLPENTADLFFASQLRDWENRLEQVSSALGINSSELLWKNTGYIKTP